MTKTHSSHTRRLDEAAAGARLGAFWKGSSLGRPALHAVARNPRFEDRPFAKSCLTLKQRDLDPDWHAWYAENELTSLVYLAEAMPVVTVRYGASLALLAVLLGNDLTYDTSNDTAWVHPDPAVLDKALPRFDPAHPVVEGLTRCICTLADVVGDRGSVGAPPLLDALTTLSVLRGNVQLCVDLIEQPGTIKEWCQAFTTMHLDCQRYFANLLRSLGYSAGRTWLRVTAEGRFEAVQCDFAVMISRPMFVEFALPELRCYTDYYDYSLYHLDGTAQLRFLDLLQTLPRLNGIQWNPEPGADDPLAWLPTFQDIRRRGWLLYLLERQCRPIENAMAIVRTLGPDGLFLELPVFDTVAEAEAAIAAITNASKGSR